MSNFEEPLRATIQFAVDDLKQTLSTIRCKKDGDTDLLFVNGVLLARSENSDGFARQAPIPLVEGDGDSMAFSVATEKLRALSKLGRELQMCIDVKDHFSSHVHASETSDVSNDLNWECQRIPVEDHVIQGKMLPGELLKELLRVVEPFAHNRQRGFLEPLRRVDVVEMTKDGLVCHSPEDERVCVEAQGLTEFPWTIPVEVLPAVRAYTRNWKSFHLGTEDDRSWVADGQGALVSWRTRLPVDVDVDAGGYEPDLDQFVATVPGKKLQSALECLTSCSSWADGTVVLRFSPLDRSNSFELTCQGSTYQTSVPLNVQRNRLEGEIEARFGLGSLKKALMGRKGRSLQLRLHRHDGERQAATWQLRSVDSYSLVNSKEGSGAQPDAHPIPCRVTRMATSLARGRQIELG